MGAGENWDAAVAQTVSRGLSGVEALSSIPGSCGATPVQNVGAYGQEIAQVLLELEAFDLRDNRLVTIAASDCGFGYRDSKFKNEWKNRYAIVSLTLLLSKNPPRMPSYPGVKAYFAQNGIENPSLQQIRDAIIEIRKKKLPDPRDIASCGSFFKNPIVEAKVAAAIKEKYPDAVQFPMPDGTVKLAAGWMLEQAGFKGVKFGRIGVYSHNALVLVNLGGASREELSEAVLSVQAKVAEEFGVALEPEVLLLA